MTNKLKAALSGGGFYAALAACVLAVGVGGYLLLFRRDEPVEAGAPAPIEVPAPVQAAGPYVTDSPDPEPVPDPVPASAPAEMPEVVVDDTPVMAEPPQVVVRPLHGEILAAFSMDQLAYDETMGDWRTHDGIDIEADTGTTVLAAAAGTVASIEDDLLMGTVVAIDHPDGCRTTYAGLQSRPNVGVGDAVSAGQVIGAVGAPAAAESARGPHLHFSVSKDGQSVDPETYLKK